MPIDLASGWQQLALYAVGAALLLFLLFKIPVVGGLLRGLFSLGLLALAVFFLLRQAPFEPTLAALTDRLGLNSQEVVGQEVRIRMSPDGHFWARTSVNGTPVRMLVDSGATVTALAADTVQTAGVELDQTPLPMALRTANGVVSARGGTIETLELGGIEARKLKIVTSDGLGDVNVLGMNFLSQLASWRVEGRVLILTPKGATGRPPMELRVETR